MGKGSVITDGVGVSATANEGCIMDKGAFTAVVQEVSGNMIAPQITGHLRQTERQDQQTEGTTRPVTAQHDACTVTDSPDSSHCMTKARQNQLGPQVLDALEQPCPTGVQPSRGQLLEQESCYSECVSPLLVLAAHLRCLVQHTLKRQALKRLPCKQGI